MSSLLAESHGKIETGKYERKKGNCLLAQKHIHAWLNRIQVNKKPKEIKQFSSLKKREKN